jgi:hypothetical protein
LLSICCILQALGILDMPAMLGEKNGNRVHHDFEAVGEEELRCLYTLYAARCSGKRGKRFMTDILIAAKQDTAF